MIMLRGIYQRVALVIGLTIGTLPTVHAEYPDREINIHVFASTLKGDTGSVLSELQPFLSKYLNNVKIVLKPSPASAKTRKEALDPVLGGKPDGYTLFFGSASAFSIYYARNPQIEPDWEQFHWIDIFLKDYLACSTSSTSEYRDWQKFFSQIRTSPKSIRHAYWSTVSHLYPTYFMRLLGQRYDRITSLQQEQMDPAVAIQKNLADFYCPALSTAITEYREGGLVPIFTNHPTGIPSMPEVPTANKIGLKGAERFSIWYAFVAPKNLPPAIEQRIKKALLQIANDPDWKKTNYGKYTVATTGKVKDIKKFIQEENDYYENLVILSKISK